MSRKVLRISYKLERDRLTRDSYDIHCDQCLDILLLDRRGVDTGWLPPSSAIQKDGICLDSFFVLQCLRKLF